MFLEPYVKGSSVCPIYFLLQSRHVNRYMPHLSNLFELYLFLFLVKSLYMVFSVLKEILRLEFFNSFAMNFVLYQCM